MSTVTRVRNRVLAVLLALMMIIAMIPVNVISASAATEDHQDVFTLTVKDSENAPIENADIEYSVKVDGEEKLKDKVTTGVDGVAVIKDLDTLELSDNPVSEVALDAEISKIGYEDIKLENEKIEDIKGNIDVEMTAKETVTIVLSFKDSVNKVSIPDVDFKIDGYHSFTGKSKSNGAHRVVLYKGESYTIEASKKGYLPYSSSDTLTFDENGVYSVYLQAKAIDNTFKFAEESPADLEYGDDSYSNTASCTNSTGSVSYSVVSGDSVSVDAETGAVTTLQAGTSTIQALLSEDENYRESKITYQITVTNAPDYGFGFTDPSPANKKFAKNGTYTNTASGGYGEGAVSYAVTSGDAATVDASTGTLTFVKAGTVVVTATRAADSKYAETSASYTLTIEKADQETLSFEVLSPANQYITHGSYTNEAVGGSGNGAITYSVVKGKKFAEIEDKNSPVVTFKNAGGPVEIEAVKAGDDGYEPTSATYTFYIIRSPQGELAFETTKKTIEYAPGLVYNNPLIGGSGTGAVTYEIVSGDAAEIDKNTGNMKILKASDEKGVVVKATKAGDNNYKSRTAQFTLIINKAKQTGFSFADGDSVSKVWSPDDNTYINAVRGGQSTGDVTYKFTASNMPFGGACASFDNETGKVTMHGKGTVTVQAFKAGDDNYLPTVAEYTLTINRAKQKGFAFTSDVPKTLTYNDRNNTFDLSTEGGNGVGGVTYSVESGDAVTINKNKVAVLKSGEVSIKATKAETNEYDAATTTLDLSIKKAPQYIAFENTTTTSVIYGNEFSNKAYAVENTSVPDGKGYAPLTEITYSVIEGEKIVSVDKYGKLTFSNNATGKIKIRAEKAGDDRYEDTVADYSLDVVFSEVPETSYHLNGKKLNDSGWFSDSVTITPPEGYQISYSNALVDNAWSDELIVSEEGYNGKTVYLKKDSDITDAVLIPEYDIRIDRTVPKDLSISYSTPVMGAILEGMTFGFYQAPVIVTIKATDDISHIASFEYTYGDVTETIKKEQITFSDKDDKKTAQASFTIPTQYRGKVSFKAVDTAGNYSDKFDDQVIVADDVAPGVTVSYDPAEDKAVNGHYYNTERTATITIDEANFFSEALNEINDISVDPSVTLKEHLVITVVKKDDNNNTETKQYKSEDLKTPFTKTEDGKWAAEILFKDDADYTLQIDYKDFSGNDAETYNESFTIDKTSPEISISYDNNEPQNESYYNNDRTATVTVIEHNFRPSDIVVEPLTSTDVQGKDIELSKNYQDLLRNGKWTDEGNTHTLSIPFDANAKYKFNITYADMANNAQTKPIDDGFTVDKNAPNELAVSYSKSVVDTILESVTFGFYQAPVTVTITADDSISGVDYFTYSYGVQVGASVINEGKADTIINRENIDYSNENKTATASFTIPAQFRGSVSFSATDMAGNTSETFNDDKVIVVDDVAPGVTVSYDPTQEKAANGYYYNTDRTATITINEANFFNEAFEKIEDISVDPAALIDEHLVITVDRTDDDNKTETKVIKSADLTTEFTKTDEDVWSATLLFDQDGAYNWTIDYKDFSGNTAGTFTDFFVIDKTGPIIDISYDNNNAQNENNYKADRTATVKVIERNFTPENIVVDLAAVDIQGNAVDYGKDYQKILREGEWKDIGNNTYTFDIPFDVDARYSFEINITDLADNIAAEPVKDEFIVDKVAPNNLKVSYSESILDALLKTATFGFYQAPMTVTIEADDNISGIDYFTYSYDVTDGESEINEGESGVVIPEKDITYIDKKHAVATFMIDPQFRGEVSFTATDRSGNISERFGDGKEVIVDNVAPGVSVTYNNNSASYETYYNLPRTAFIKIKEANFFDESIEKIENIASDPSTMIDEHLKIMVTATDNDGISTTKQIKKEDLETQFVKSADEKDTWIATLLFDQDADYEWSVEYKDFSGNEAAKFTDSFTVDNINPKIKVEFKNNDAKNEKYFKADRPATITITEHNFNAKDVKVTVDTSRATGKVADYQSYLTDPANWKQTGNEYTTDILFDTEAYYQFDISYKDMAGRENDPVDYGDSIAPTDFVIDKTAPTDADITINDKSVLATNGIAFEKFYQSSAVVKYSVNCDISELDNIKYQKVDSVEAYDPNAEWIDFNDSVKIDPSEKFIIYFKAEDKAGNYTIVNSTGIVVDDVPPEGERYAPDIDIEPAAANENGLHNSDVNVALNVVEPKVNGSSRSNDGYYSGINKITYRIYTKDTDASEQGTLLDIAAEKTTGAVVDNDKLISKWSGNITVNAATFNSNQVVVEVTAIDNAGNERVTTNDMINNPIRIDVTSPSIDVSYQDGSDNGDSTFTSSANGAYFKNNRTATIVITERNFDERKVKITATKDGQPYTPALSGWSASVRGGNGDGTTHTATITYSSDGIYSFDISFTDQADNKNTAVNYNGLSPQLFTVDKTNPVFSISYDNNSAQNGNYYKAQRVATLTIEERNFEESRINITMTANNNGSGVGTPAVNGWSTSGDTHTATITYSSDALYEFDIEYNDKAGNPLSEDYQRDSFYVDQTKPKVSIQKIVDKSANNDTGNIGYTITATDTNFDVFTPKLIAIVKEGNRFVVKELDAGSMTTVSNGRMYVVTNLPNDGVYKISCTVVDKAGNAYEDVTLSKDRDDRETYTEKRAGNDTLLTFSVNREGSTFNLDDNTINLLNRYYVQNVDHNVVIDEINVDTLEKRQVSINGRDLTDSEYGFEQSGGDDENWYRYQYTIDRTLFNDEGEYNVVVSSKDRATNDAFSDVKDAGIEFIVDHTAPIVTVTGLANDGRYQTESQTVTAVPTDDGGALKSIQVTLIGKDGNADKELLNLSDDNFMKALEEGDGKVTFEIPEGLYQDIRIICDDQAFYGDHENILYDKMFTNVSVTPNGFLIFWANKPLRYGILGGVVLLVAGIVALIIMKKRKKKTPVAK